MDMQNDFFLTLSSDGSDFFNKTNTMSDFQIRLSNPIDLSKGAWVVGLVSLQYNQSIDNVGEELITIFNGVDSEKIIKFPRWCCTRTKTLLEYINKNLTAIKSTHKKRLSIAAQRKKTLYENPLYNSKPDEKLFKQMLEQLNVQSMPAHSDNEHGFSLSRKNIFNNKEKDNDFYQEHKITIKEFQEYMELSEKKRTKRDIHPDTDNETDEDNKRIKRENNQDTFTLRRINTTEIPTRPDLSKLNFIDLTSESQTITTPEIEDNNIQTSTRTTTSESRDIQTIIEKRRKEIEEEEEIREPVLIKNGNYDEAYRTYTKMKLVYPKLISITKGNETENETYPNKFEIDNLDLVTIDCQSPDIDIGISDNLLNMLGFDTNSSIKSQLYKRRMFFRSYLTHYAKNPAFLQGKLLTILAKNDKIMKDDKDYFKYINHTLTDLLDINVNEAWYDFNSENPYGMFDNGEAWPNNTKWETYFENFKIFRNRLESIDGEKFFTQNPYKETIRGAFSKRGTALFYFMLKTLLDETNNDNKLKATTPPNMSYENDVFYVYTDIINPHTINETTMPLLAITQADLSANGENRNIKKEILNVQYRNCISHPQINNIRIYTATLMGNKCKFMRGPVIVELHFQRTRIF